MLGPVVENGALAAVEIEIEEQKMICPGFHRAKCWPQTAAGGFDLHRLSARAATVNARVRLVAHQLDPEKFDRQRLSDIANKVPVQRVLETDLVAASGEQVLVIVADTVSSVGRIRTGNWSAMTRPARRPLWISGPGSRSQRRG